MTAKEIARLLGLLKAADPKMVAEIIQDQPDLIGKAHAVELEDAERVVDLRTDGQEHAVPSREEIKTGPAARSSGGGAEAMIGEYSRVAPQRGVTTEAMRLADILEDFRGSMKSLAEAYKSQTAILAAFFAKAADEKDEEEDDDDKEMHERSKARAEGLIARAKALLSKADKEESEEDDEEDEGKAKAHRRAARVFKKRASLMLGKAQVHAFAAADESLKKSIRLIAAKADIVIKADDDEDDDKEEKDEKDKAEKARLAAEAAAKAEANKDTTGNQADKAGKDGNQADAANKAVDPATKLQIEEALKGIRVLEGNINTLMDAISGRSKGAATPGATIAPPDLFAFVKADPTAALASIQAKIDAAAEDGTIDGSQQMHALSLLQKIDAFNRGLVAKSVVDGLLSTAPAALRQIFQKAA